MNALAQSWSDLPPPPRVPRPRRRQMTAGADPRAAEPPEALIAAIAQRADRAAFTALFHRFAPRVKSYLVRRGLAPEAAEELAQEALLTVWRKAGQFDPRRAGASTWIFTIARNLGVDAQRRHRAPGAPDPAEPESAPPAEPGLLAAERDLRVRAALQALSREQAQIVELSFFAEEPHTAIAERLGVPLGTVKSRLRLAIGRLRALLEDIR